MNTKQHTLLKFNETMGDLLYDPVIQLFFFFHFDNIVIFNDTRRLNKNFAMDESLCMENQTYLKPADSKHTSTVP